MIFLLLISIFYYIQCYCDGDHDRIDLSKEECDRYEIDQDEIEDGENVYDYRCCFFSYFSIAEGKAGE